MLKLDELEEWAARHTVQYAVLKSYLFSPDPKARAFANKLIGLDGSTRYADWDLVTSVLSQLKRKPRRGRPRDEYISKVEAEARAELPPDCAATTVAAKMAEKLSADPESIRSTLQRRQRTDRKKGIFI